MDWLLILFRLTHVPAAIIWAGGAIVLQFYVQPAMGALGSGAQPFANELFVNRKLSAFFAIAATLTVVGGGALYIHDAGGLQLWTSPTGWVFTVGAICGILAWASGGARLAPAIRKVSELGAEIAGAGGPPSAELMARMGAAQARVRRIGQTDTALIIVAVLAMATARYFG